MKKIILFIGVLLISLVCVSCGETKVEVKGITISSSEDLRTVEEGKTLQLIAVVYPTEASQEVLWSTEDNLIATVDDSGLVTGVSVGTVNIIATSKDNQSVSQKFALIVTEAEEVVINPTSVTVTSVDDSTTCKVGQTLSLMAIVEPREASQNVSWSSADPSIATVNRGDVTALKEGTVTITATSKVDQSVYGSLDITITAADKPVVSAEWADMEFTSHELYEESENDTKLKIKGVVTHVCALDTEDNTVSYFIQNGSDGYYVYAQDFTTYPVEEGKVYEVGGYKKYYKGLCEIVNVEYFVESNENITFDYVNLGENDPTDLASMKPFQGAYVTVKGTYTGGTLKDSSAFNVTVNVNGYNTTLRIDPSYAGDEFSKIYSLLLTAIDGVEIEVKGFMTAFGHSNSSVSNQIQIVKATDLTIEKASDEQILNACLSKISVDTSVSYAKNEIELPTEIAGFEEVVVSWSSNSELINTETKQVSHSSVDTVVTLTVTLSVNGTEITDTFEVLVVALDETEYEVLATLDLEDASTETIYDCSLTKPGYDAANVTLGTPKHTWLLSTALIAGSSSDRLNGTFSIRAKAGSSAETTGRIEILDAGEYNVVEFSAGVFGSHTLGTQIRVEYTTDDGATWNVASTVITLNSYTLETFRVKLPEGVKRVAIVVVENSGKSINIDDIKLMK